MLFDFVAREVIKWLLYTASKHTCDVTDASPIELAYFL